MKNTAGQTDFRPRQPSWSVCSPSTKLWAPTEGWASLCSITRGVTDMKTKAAINLSIQSWSLTASRLRLGSSAFHTCSTFFGIYHSPPLPDILWGRGANRTGDCIRWYAVLSCNSKAPWRTTLETTCCSSWWNIKKYSIYYFIYRFRFNFLVNVFPPNRR